MALHDNPQWLLANTRDAFLTNDDTGMCEVVMVSENLSRRAWPGKLYSFPGVDEEEEDDDATSHSYEIHSNLHFGIHRHRSNTAQRLERMEEEKKRAANITHFKWIQNPYPLTDEEKEEFFPKKDINKIRERESTKKVSLLTELLANSPPLAKNPFHQYAKFDGNAQVGMPTKKYSIFLTMLRENGNYPMKVVIIATAKISDLIGLICWKCSNEYSDVSLKDSVNHYGLYIAEDDGEVDREFPSLDAKETVSKFGFTYLALVERDPSLNHEDSCLSFPIYRDDSTSRNLENACGKTREQIQMEEEMVKFRGQMTAIEAPLYQNYVVSIVSKVRTKAEVYLGISGEKIEIDPVATQRSGAKLWGRQRALVYAMDTIVACHLTESKPNNKASFRIVYEQKLEKKEGQGTESSFKHHDFEADSGLGAEIVEKVNHILEVRQSARRREYIALRERKAHRRKTFRLVPR